MQFQGFLQAGRRFALTALCALPTLVHALPIQANLSAIKSGPIHVTSDSTQVTVLWEGQKSEHWRAVFSLDSTKPRITSIQLNNKLILEEADPVYRCAVGKRTGGWDAFFDIPPAAPEGTRSFYQTFHPTTLTARTVGNRVEIEFNGMDVGVFHGVLKYVFYPGSGLMQQVAVLATNEPDTAYTYDTGIAMKAKKDLRPGRLMATAVSYYDAEGKLQQITSPYGSERHTLQVHYRAVAAKSGEGSVAVFPAPHRYLFARDYSTNLGYAWYSAWRGKVELGIQQPPDDNTRIYPWINAPVGTQQEMGVFFLLSGDGSDKALQQVQAYTHGDHFQHLDGFVTFAPHWHFAFTEQAVANGPKWTATFKPVLENVGIDAAMIMDFHGDGHPRNLGETRLKELKAYYENCRNQSDQHFLLIPAEEANVILGGHWSIVFPHPVYWMMDRKAGEPLQSTVAPYGNVYRVHSSEDVWKMVEQEKAIVYQTHPRTKGSTGYPDKILSTDYFRSPQYAGVGWKAMPSDLSSSRLGERAFKTLDDLNNLNLHKVIVGENDLFQIASTDELYAHMNVNYVPLSHLPDFDHYGELVNNAFSGEGFISTGEILFHDVALREEAHDEIAVSAKVDSTFPLRFAEVVWGDGKETHHETFDLQNTPAFDTRTYNWKLHASGWKWARLAVWDIAADGAFTNPMWKIEPRT